MAHDPDTVGQILPLVEIVRGQQDAVPELRSPAIIWQASRLAFGSKPVVGSTLGAALHPAGTLVPAAAPLLSPSALLTQTRCAAEWELGRRLSCLLQPE